MNNLFLIYGSDINKSLKYLAELKAKFSEKNSDLNIVNLAPPLVADELAKHATSIGLFCDKRLAIAKNIINETTADILNTYIPILEKTPETNFVVFFENANIKNSNSKFVNFLKKNSCVKHFEKNEIDTSKKIFELPELIYNKNPQAFFLLDDLLKKGNDPNLILGIIANTTRQLAQIVNCPENNPWEISLNTKVPYFITKKLINLKHKISFESILQIFQKLCCYDFSIKSGKIEPRLAITMLVGEMITNIE
ncbi:MAG: hypothetical protein CEN91_575 [Candidatus Berkelbacteria bacterium Licking1014_85]|uniref:DNA-directed DNA polymerase n=1 Tax=Candidatus Berkelbacteria bacterium Licking1014_85 TaxID=2017148 RepID=A0A554LGX4_9BACT|nr:MAG: hypothetical protein CEN91_575 [Candidatus Berkelbacteria bacterium Licking1014_85]